MTTFRSEIRVPVEVHSETYRSRNPSASETQSTSSSRPTMDKDTNRVPWHRPFSDGIGRFNNFSDGDDWFEQTKRKFDARRRQWEQDVQRMRDDFFSPDRSTNSLLHGRLDSGMRAPLSQPFSSSYEQAADGTVNFVANFDVHGFQPGEIKVVVRDNQLTVSGKTETREEYGGKTREYTRTIDFPRGANEEMAQASLSADSVLTITCPVNRTPFTKDMENDPMERSTSSSVSSQGTSHYGQPRLIEHTISRRITPGLGSGRSRFRLELPLDTDYIPSDIQIRTLNRRIYVNARHEDKGPNRTSLKEFSKQYDIPDNVNPESLEARFESGMLCIEDVSNT